MNIPVSPLVLPAGNLLKSRRRIRDARLRPYHGLHGTSMLRPFPNLHSANLLPTIIPILNHNRLVIRKMPTPEILKIPNLLSLSRIALAPIICHFLSRNDTTGIMVSLILMVVAGITDGLDGYLARRWKQTGRLGTALDPIADKLFAALLVICLIIHRDFPIWLASVIVGRDLLIVGLGMLLLGDRNISLPSNLTGKYAFTAIVVLLASYVIRFEFGIMLTTWTTMILIAASLYGYGRVFVMVKRGKPAPEFTDKKYLMTIRTAATTVYTIIFFYKLYVDLLR